MYIYITASRSSRRARASRPWREMSILQSKILALFLYIFTHTYIYRYRYMYIYNRLKIFEACTRESPMEEDIHLAE